MAATSIGRRRLILASTSPFRRALLQRLGIPFETRPPEVDETPALDEDPRHLAQRLALMKARTIAGQEPDALVIGSDQVAALRNTLLGKPHDHRHAVDQLYRASGETVSFFTGLCLIDSRSGRTQVDVVPFQVVFRALDRSRIERYLQRERPYQCAGSFKSEGLGIALFERLQGDDPTSLIGLPLIRLTRMLENEGIDVL
jgi:MAF protein